MWTAARSSDARPTAAAPAGQRPARLAAPGLFLLLLAGVGPSTGTDPRDPAVALAVALDREIAALESELGEIESARSGVASELDRLATREALSRRRWLKAKALRDGVARQVAEEEGRCEELGRAAEISRSRARGALRETYKQGDMAGYTSLLSVSGPSDLLRAFQHLGAVARRQTEALSSFEARRAEARQAARRLQESKAGLDAAVAEAVGEEKHLAEDRAARLILMERLQSERGLHENAMAELARAALALSEAARSVTSGGRPPNVSIAFDRLKGGLPWPADGPVAVPFGSIRHPRFGTQTPHPGLDIQVAPGAVVRAVGAGRVVFSRRYGGYGRTVVIDHGERYLSVYARLAASAVAEGEDVSPGQGIGFAPEPDAGGNSSIYFEIRHVGRALDPAGWLRRRAPMASKGAGR